ncbi:MAG: RNA polymerase sigma factor [Ktedonobacteraceae bacterium]|nr:RNA polymerase sigma factor [Ktedonobacteraceae bacterium]
MTRYNEKGTDELTLVLQTIQGDHEAFRRLVLLYESELLTYLTYLLGDRGYAQDIVQETFITAFYALPRWHPPQHTESFSQKEENQQEASQPKVRRLLAPWLYRIATNHAYNFLKRELTKRPRALHEILSPGSCQQITVPVDSNTSLSVLENQYITRELLRESLSNLPKEEAICLILRFVLKERYKEIAVALGLTEEAVRKRVSRGIVALRTAYRNLDTEVSL